MIRISVDWKKSLPRRGELAKTAPHVESKQGWAFGICNDARLSDNYVTIEPKKLRSGELWSELAIAGPSRLLKHQELVVNGVSLGMVKVRNVPRGGVWGMVPSHNDWDIETAYVVVPEKYVDDIMRSLGVATRKEGWEHTKKHTGKVIPISDHVPKGWKKDQPKTNYLGRINKDGYPHLSDYRRYKGKPWMSSTERKERWDNGET